MPARWRSGSPRYTEPVKEEEAGPTSLILEVDDDLLKQARDRALEQGTSVNALLLEYLEEYVGIRDRHVKAVEELLTISERSLSRRGSRSWTRDELHE